MINAILLKKQKKNKIKKQNSQQQKFIIKLSYKIMHTLVTSNTVVTVVQN